MLLRLSLTWYDTSPGAARQALTMVMQSAVGHVHPKSAGQVAQMPVGLNALLGAHMAPHSCLRDPPVQVCVTAFCALTVASSTSTAATPQSGRSRGMLLTVCNITGQAHGA
jgi:hypothetical protein